MTTPTKRTGIATSPSLNNKIEAEVKLDASWKKILGDEFDKPYMLALKNFLNTAYTKKQIIFPKGSEYFTALDLTPFKKVKVVILGQDPYHGPNQSHGLCFSVNLGVTPPPSLRNIYKEIKSDLGITQPDHGFLESWAKQGVLLLNSILTVEQGLAGSHAGKGWELFTDRIIYELNTKREGIVFVLWGAYAQKKGQIIDKKKHFVIQSVHPSPLSASRGFFGSRPFSQINSYLKKQGQKPIDWQLPALGH